MRIDDLPLVLPALGAQGLPRGTRVRIRLGSIDEITLDVSSTVIEQLDTQIQALPENQNADQGDDGNDSEDGDGDLAAGPISIAVDVSEPPADADAVTAAAG